jgi:hypothetical protein
MKSKNYFLLASWKSLTKKSRVRIRNLAVPPRRSRSVSKRYGSGTMPTTDTFARTDLWSAVYEKKNAYPPGPVLMLILGALSSTGSWWCLNRTGLNICNCVKKFLSCSRGKLAPDVGSTETDQQQVNKYQCFRQCCGSVTFWYGSGSGSADPYLWPTDLDSDTKTYGFGTLVSMAFHKKYN